MKIAVDVDGVLADHVPHILRRVKEHWGATFDKSEVKLWDQPIPETETSIDAEIEAALDDPSYILTMPMVHLGLEGIKALLGFGHKIIIATSRPPDTDPYTLQWLCKKEIPYHGFLNTRKSGKTGLEADILIDDRLENARDFALGRGYAILFSQPWNEERGQLFNLIKSGKLFCAESWPDVVNFIGLLGARLQSGQPR